MLKTFLIPLPDHVQVVVLQLFDARVEVVVLGAEGVVERLQHLHLLLLLVQQVLLPVPVVAAPQHVLVHLLRIAAFVLQKYPNFWLVTERVNLH